MEKYIKLNQYAITRKGRFILVQQLNNIYHKEWINIDIIINIGKKEKAERQCHLFYLKSME